MCSNFADRFASSSLFLAAVGWCICVCYILAVDNHTVTRPDFRKLAKLTTLTHLPTCLKATLHQQLLTSAFRLLQSICYVTQVIHSDASRTYFIDLPVCWSHFSGSQIGTCRLHCVLTEVVSFPNGLGVFNCAQAVDVLFRKISQGQVDEDTLSKVGQLFESLQVGGDACVLVGALLPLPLGSTVHNLLGLDFFRRICGLRKAPPTLCLSLPWESAKFDTASPFH